MDNSELDPESSFSTTGKGNNNELEKKLVLKGLNSNDARNSCLALIHAIEASDVDNVKLSLKNYCIVNKSDVNMFDIPLHHAIEAGNLQIIELLLNAGASLLAIGKTPLYKAMKNQQFDVVDLMLSKYNTANINPKNKQEFVYFIVACIRNNGNLVEQFIKKGIDVNGILDDCADEWTGHTPLYLSVKYLSVEVVKILLKHNANSTFQDQNGNSPLHLAYYAWKSENSDTNKNQKASDIMDLILASPENIVNSVNEDGLSLLHVACTRNSIDVIKKLLLTTSDVNAHVHENSSEWAGYTALHFAASTQNLDAIRVLLEHQADVNVVEGRGLTPLWLSLEAQPKYIQIKNIINDKFRNEVKSINKEQLEKSFFKRNLMYDERVNKIETIGEETNKDENLLKIIGSLLQEFKNIKVVELLVNSKSNLNHKNNSGEPLLFAAYQSFVHCSVNENRISEVIISEIFYLYFQETAMRIMDCLINHGIELNARDSKNNHILHITARSACDCCNKQCAGVAVKIAEMMLKNGANVNVSDNTGATPLHHVLRHDNLWAELVELFLQFKADVDATDENQRTPLHTAVRHCRDEFEMDSICLRNLKKAFDCLFRSKCNVNARDTRGRTPLHLAAYRRNAFCIALLLDNGADISVKDSDNQNTFDALGYDTETDGFVEECLLRSAFECMLWHVLKLLVIGHPVDPSHLLRYERRDDGKRFEFYYRDLSICVEENDDTESYYRGIIVCAKIDNDRCIPRGYRVKVRENVAKLRDEVAKLKDAKIDDYNSLYDILGKNLQQMTTHARNEALKKQICSENLSEKFPNYAYLLKLKFREGSARNEILEKANESLRYVTRTNLPYICVDNIFSYISNKDMQNLVLATQ